MNYHISIIQELENLLGIKLYLVGGAVRDLTLAKPVKDWDFASPSTPDEVEQAVIKTGRKPYILGKRFGTIGFKYEINNTSEMIEITTFRNELYQPQSRKPIVEFSSNLFEDLSRRDFTINAMAIEKSGTIIDLFDGQRDLKNKIIRAVSDPVERFTEDPLRILRAIRFASKLGFEIEPNTLSAIRTKRFELLQISKERWVMELDQILTQKNPETGLELLMQHDIFQVIVPEISLQKHTPIWEQTKTTIANLDNDPTSRWAALCSLISLPYLNQVSPTQESNLLSIDLVKKLGTHLKFSKDRIKTMTNLIYNQNNH
jgi:tRNA nucleotidyltransferase/poly(A) polymerase